MANGIRAVPRRGGMKKTGGGGGDRRRARSEALCEVETDKAVLPDIESALKGVFTTGMRPGRRAERSRVRRAPSRGGDARSRGAHAAPAPAAHRVASQIQQLQQHYQHAPVHPD